jgi:hypothetical protein
MTARDVFATLVRPKTSSETVSGASQFSTDAQAVQGTMSNRTVSPRGLRAAMVAYMQSLAPKAASLVIGPTNTLQHGGLWIRTVNGVPQGLVFDDSAGSNDGQVVGGQSNPLTGPGIWVKTRASDGKPIGVYYYDGVQ